MAYGPKPLLPFEEKNGRVDFVLMRLACDQVPPGTCGATTRGCATCRVPPPPTIKPEVARVLLDILLRRNAEDQVTGS
jgi:hypothetical protein